MNFNDESDNKIQIKEPPQPSLNKRQECNQSGKL